MKKTMVMSKAMSFDEMQMVNGGIDVAQASYTGSDVSLVQSDRLVFNEVSPACAVALTNIGLGTVATICGASPTGVVLFITAGASLLAGSCDTMFIRQ